MKDIQTKFSENRSSPSMLPPFSTLCWANIAGIGWNMSCKVQLPVAPFFKIGINSL